MSGNTTPPPKREVARVTTRGTKWIGQLLLCLGLLAQTLSASADPAHSALQFNTVSELHAIGYEARWQKQTQQAVIRATDDKQPYLANRLLRQLALHGDRVAAFRLGLFYDVNTASDHDPDKALYWYRRAAAAGEIHALHNLGVAYANGKGVELDMQQAVKWWTLAAQRGNSDSQYNLGILYAAGEYGVRKNIERAKHWWRRAALHGDAMAQYNLGTLYVNSGVRDYCEAARWWKAAASNGVEQAGLALRLIKSRQGYQTCR
jgi:TPR repeat protein